MGQRNTKNKLQQERVFLNINRISNNEVIDNVSNILILNAVLD